MNIVYYVDFNNKKLLDKQTAEPDTINAMIDFEKIPDKKTYFEQLMNSGVVQIFINPKVRGVKLPSNLKKEPVVALNWSYKFNIADFVFDHKSIRGTLSFNAQNFFVEIPWKSIWAMFLTKNRKESTKIWSADAPKEISIVDFMNDA